MPHADAGLDGVMILIVVATVVEVAVVVILVPPGPDRVLFPLKEVEVTFFLTGGSRGVPSDPGSKDFVSVPFL